MFIPWEQGVQLGGGVLGKDAKPQQAGLLGFLQSPQAMALAQGFLEGGQPSFDKQNTFGSGFATGLGNIRAANKLQNEEQLARDALKQQELLEKARIAISQGHLDVDRAKLDLDRAHKQQQQELLKSLLTNENLPEGVDAAGDNRQQRAAILAAAGYTEKAFKVLTEKPKEDLTEKPTRTVITQNQQISQAVDNVVPQIKELMQEDIPIQSPNIWGLKKTTSLLSPEKQARYESKVAGITDTLVAALALPKTNESIHLVGQMIRKQFGESDEAYFKRLDEVVHDLERRKENALKVTSAVGEKSASKGGSTVIGVTPDGRRVNVPADKIDEFISKGGKRG